jgi:hypothetical protein
MGCKFKYNGQTYESEADLKAVLRQELKANTAKVRDGDKQTTTYSKLGTKTVSGNVVVKNVYQQEGVQYAKSIGGIFSLRINNSNTHFGNPFSPVQAEVDKGLIAAKSTKEAVEITQRFIELMNKSTGIDISNYDGAIINLYTNESFIGNHSDLEESITAEKYPIVVANIGGSGNIILGTNKNQIKVELESGDSYLFGFKGKNRKIPHSTYASDVKGFLPNITISQEGKTFNTGSYRISITMRRVMPLTAGMPQAPSIVSKTVAPTQPTTNTIETSIKRNFVELENNIADFEPKIQQLFNNPTIDLYKEVVGLLEYDLSADVSDSIRKSTESKLRDIKNSFTVTKSQQKITDAEVEAMTKALVEMYPEIKLSIEDNPNFVDKEGVFNQIEDNDFINLVTHDNLLTGNIVIGDSFATFTLDLKAGELKDISLAKELQGKGIGSDIYLKLNALLNRKGMVLKSSDNLSKASEALWESLYKKGYVEKTPAKIKRNYEDVIQEGVTDLSGKMDIVDGFTYKFKNNQQTNIKEGVPELFDSNPELANAVYEALGLKSKLSDIKPKVSITNYRNVTKQDKQNAVNGDIEAQKKWMIEEISEFYEAVDGFNNNTMSIDDVGEEVLGLFRTAQQFPEVKDFINPYIEDVQIALDNINKKEQYDKFKSKKTAKGQAEDMTFDNLFDFVNSFPNSKKQQALQLYSQYLDTIFPDSKVKDIVYHGTQSKDKFNKFERKSELYGFYFTSYENYSKQYGNNISSIINLVNPKTYDNIDKKEYSKIANLISKDEFNEYDGINIKNFLGSNEIVVFEPEQIHILGSKQDVQGFKEFQNQQDTLLLNQKTGKDKIIGQADIQARKILIDAAFKNKPDLASHEFAHFYIAWFRNTPLVQQGIKMYGSEEALVQAIGEQAVVQRGKAWSWWKKFVAWLLNSANDVSDLTKENLRDILTDAFLSRQDLNKQAGTEAGVKLEKNVAVLGGETYLWNNNTGFWQPFTKSEADIEYSNDEMQKLMQKERDAKAQVKNDPIIKPAWKNNKRAALENRLLNIHKAIALHPVNAQNLLAPVSTVITKGIVEKLGIRAKHETRGAVIDPLSNINASIAMVQGKQGVGVVANAINTKAALTGVDAKLTLMYPVQSPLSNDEKHIQLPINLRMLGIEKVKYADGTSAYSLGKLVDTFGNSIISNLSESLTQQVDNVKDPVAVELGYTLKTLGLTSYILTLGVPQEVLAGLTAKGGVVTAWNDRVEENENLFHKGVTEESYEVVEYTGEPRKISTRFEESNSTLKIEFINSLLRKQPVPSKYIETVVDNNGRPKGHILKHEALDIDNVSLDKYDAVKLLFYWELIDQARAYGNTIKALTADTKTHKSIDAAAQQQLLINQQLQGVESIVDKDDISKVISSKAALKSNTKSVISPFFNMQRKYGEYFSKYFYTHENGISAYLAASLKARYKLYSGDKLNRLISTAHNDFMIYLMTRMTAVNPNTTSSLAKFNNANAPLVGVDALLKHGEGLKMSAVNSIYNNLTLISKQPNITASRAYYYAQPTTVRNNNTTALYQNVTPEMARALLDIFRFELGRVIKADVNIDNNVSIYLQNIPSIDLIMFKDSAITTSAANNYIEIFEELRKDSPGLIQLFNSISLFQAGLNNSPYNLFKTLPITDLLAEDKSKSLVSNLATTIKTFDKLLPKKDPTNVGATFRRDLTIQDMVDDFLRWFDLQYGKIYVQPEAASKYNKASMLYRKFDPTQQKFLIYVKPEAGGGGTPLTSVSSLTKNYLSTVPYTYAPTTTAVTNSNVITNDTINEDATIKQLESLGAFGDIIKAYVAAGGEIETLCS